MPKRKFQAVNPKRKLVSGKSIKEKEIEIVNAGNKRSFIDVDGEKYYLDREKTKKIDGIEHSVGLIYKKFDEKEYIDLLKTLIEAIKDKTTKTELLTQLLKEIDMKTLRRVVKRIESGKEVKRHSGCLGFKIGDAYVQLID